MININDIKNRSALTILEGYIGNNPYIRKLKWEFIQRKTKLTDNQLKYINDNHDKDPIKLDKVIKISQLLGEELQKQDDISFIPEKILVEYLLADTEKAFHILGKLKKNQIDSKMYWLPKTQVFDDIYFDEIDVDVNFEKYKALDSLHREPFEHQKFGVKFLLTRNGCVLALDMGLGKSMVSIIAALESKAKKILVVCPSSVKINWEREINCFTDNTTIVSGRKWKTAQFTIINYDILKNFHTIKERKKSDSDEEIKINSQLTESNFDLVIIDECFQYNTIVKTNIGNLPIGYIVENKLNVKILTYNHNNDCLEYKNIDRWIKLNKDKLLKINLSDGTSLTCTDNHKIYVKNKGYVKAINIENYDELYKMRKTINQRANLEKRKILFGEVQPISENWSKIKTNQNKTNIYQKVRNLWDRIFCLYQKREQQAKILLNKLCGKMAVNPKRYPTEKENELHTRNVLRNYENGAQEESKSSNRNIKTNERKQPNEKFGLSVKNDQFIKRANIFIERWKWAINKTTNFIKRAVKLRLDNGVSNNNTPSEQSVSIITPLLQSGYWKPKFKNCNRSGWKNTQTEKMEIFRQPKNKCFECVRVESVEILESGNRQESNWMFKNDTRVYNLEVQVNHNYFADNILVSNCHYLKNPKSIRGKIMTDLCVKHGIEKVWLLTGTPITNRPMDYYNLLRLIKSPLADNWVFYAKRYCNGKKFFKTLKTGQKKQIWLTDGASNLEELAQKTRNIVLRRTKEEALDMPDKTRIPLFHELDEDTRAEYNNLWDEYIEQRVINGKTGNIQRDLTETILLRRFIAKQSIPHTIDIANSAIDQGEKVIIFTTFTDELLELQEYFGKQCVVHYGKISDRQKQYAIDKFQNDLNIKIFIGNVISAGVGINLTAANIVIFNSYDWVPTINTQAECRAYRIGQKNNVSVYYHLFEKTVSITMWQSLFTKQGIINIIFNESVNGYELKIVDTNEKNL